MDFPSLAQAEGSGLLSRALNVDARHSGAARIPVVARLQCGTASWLSLLAPPRHLIERADIRDALGVPQHDHLRAARDGIAVLAAGWQRRAVRPSARKESRPCRPRVSRRRRAPPRHPCACPRAEGPAHAAAEAEEQQHTSRSPRPVRQESRASSTKRER